MNQVRIRHNLLPQTAARVLSLQATSVTHPTSSTPVKQSHSIFLNHHKSPPAARTRFQSTTLRKTRSKTIFLP
jgi:hypothetical protein